MTKPRWAMTLTTTRYRATWMGVFIGGGAALVGQSQLYFAWPLSLEAASAILVGVIGGALFWGLIFRYAFGRKPNGQ